jgi:hypothetical protein
MRAGIPLRGPLSLLVLASGLTLTSAEGPASTHRIEAIRSPTPIELDGHLDEPVWSTAPAATGFTQREPEAGAPATERTEVRVVYTDRKLYIGVHAFDSEPDKIIAREMQRDGALFRDDAVIILLDTFDDDRNTYFFETNAVGARTDSLVTDEGRSTNFQWDGVWDVVSRITDDGWIAEIEIPFSTLRFKSGATEWGLNVRRQIRRKNEETFWAPIGLDAGLFRVSLYGALSGVEGFTKGINLNVKPFVTAETTVDETATNGSDDDGFDAGLDVKWGVTRGLSLDLTVNTDFAETEVDTQQVNLTRFSLFFPEKREFFLENSGIFDFGTRSSLVRGFFSRRIGIGPDGQQVPIDWGVRLSGRAGPWNIGVLNVATDSVAANPAAGFAAVPENNWGTLRVKRNVGDRSSVGAIYTDRRGDGSDSNQLYGGDFDWKPTQTDDSDLASGSDRASGLSAEWSGSIWSWGSSYVDIGDRFEPESGFLRRRGIQNYASEVDYLPRPDIEGVRNLEFEIEGELFVRDDGSTESSEFGVEVFGVTFDSLDRFTPYAERSFEDLLSPFQIVPGIVIPAGEYTFDAYGIRGETNSSRKYSIDGRLQTGQFYDGDRHSVRLEFLARPNRYLRSETTWEWNEIELPAGSFRTSIVRERLGLAWSPRLRADAYIQYNEFAQLFGAHVRVNWIYRPGADLFVVYNQNWDAPSLSDMNSRDRQFVVKFTYLFQK